MPFEAWWLEFPASDPTGLLLARLAAGVAGLFMFGGLVLERASRVELSLDAAGLTAWESPGRRHEKRLDVDAGTRLRRVGERLLVRTAGRRLVVEAGRVAPWLAAVLRAILGQLARGPAAAPHCPGCGALLAAAEELAERGFANCVHCGSGWVLEGGRFARAPVRLPALASGNAPPHRHARLEEGADGETVRAIAAPFGRHFALPPLLSRTHPSMVVPLGTLGFGTTLLLMALFAPHPDAAPVAGLFVVTVSVLLIGLGGTTGVLLAGERCARLERGFLHFELRAFGIVFARRRVALAQLNALRFEGEPGNWTGLMLETAGGTLMVEFYVPDADEDRWLRAAFVDRVAARLAALGRRVERVSGPSAPTPGAKVRAKRRRRR